MSTFRIYKVVSALPGTLEPDSVYAVRTGVGFDLYISDATGTVAHKVNSGSDADRNLIADRLVQSASVSLNSNCRTKEALPATKAPVVSVTASKPIALTRTYDPGSVGQPFSFCGGNVVVSSGFASFPSTTSTSTQIGFLWRTELVLDGEEVSFNLDSSADGYRFIIDGQYVSLSGTTYSTGSPGWYTLTWATRERRTIIVEGHTTLRFGQVATNPLSKILKPSGNGIKGYFIGDSNAFVQGFNLKGNSYSSVFMDCLGISNQTVNAVSSTGFQATWGSNNYQVRQSDWNSFSQQDLVVLQMSINDITLDFTAASMKTAAASLIANIRLAHPNALILVVGIITWDEFGTSLSEHETAVEEAVSETNDDYVLFIPVRNAPEEEILTGSMYATDGTASFYVDDASGHLTYAGNQFIGRWLADRALEKISSALNIPIPVSGYAVATEATGAAVNEVLATPLVVYNSGTLRDVATGSTSTFALPGTVAVGNACIISVAQWQDGDQISAITVGGVSAVRDAQSIHPVNTNFRAEIWRTPNASVSHNRTIVVTYASSVESVWIDCGLIEVGGLSDTPLITVGSSSGNSTGSISTATLSSDSPHKLTVSAVATVSSATNHVYTELSGQTEIWEGPDSVNWMAGVGCYSISDSTSMQHNWSVSPVVDLWASAIATYSGANASTLNLLHTGNTKTVSGQSISGSGDVVLSDSDVPATVVTEAGSSRAIADSDAGKYIRFTATGAKTCTFGTGITKGEYHIRNAAASGDVTLTASSTTLNPPAGGTLVLEPGMTCTVKFVGTAEFDIIGQTVAA